MCVVRAVEGSTETQTAEAVGQGRNGMEVPAEVRELSSCPKLLSGGVK